MDTFYNITVGFDLAKSLKEKGFNEDCFSWYSPKIGGNSLTFCWEVEETPKTNSRLKDGKISAPTYDQVINWLNTKHIDIIPVFYPNEGKYGIDFFDIDVKELLSTNICEFNKTEALKLGIFTALKHIR